jgi:hypothetical protein
MLLKREETMATEFNRDAYNKVFNDLDKYRDYCRFEGKVFNEKALYNKKDVNWQAYEKYQNWLRAKARNASRKFQNRRN